ncbi:MAG: hypothetical protein ACU0DW_08375, partial [Shimia sp.]
MTIRHADFDTATPVYNVAEIMADAWAIAKDKREWCEAQDWTPGPGYGACRPVTGEERRAIFADALKTAWRVAKARVAYEQRQAIIAASPEAQAILREIDLLQNKSFSINIANLRRDLDARLDAIVEKAREARALARKAALVQAADRVTVTFRKVDGTRRTMRILPGAIAAHVKGDDASPAAQKAAATRKARHPHLLPVFDADKRAIRSVNLRTVTR